MESLQKLAQYVRSTLPAPQAILQLRINEQAAGITFIWQGVEFFVNASLYAFEVRGHTLYITGLSTLLQSVLGNRVAHERRWAVLLEQLVVAENLIRDERAIRRAVQIIRDVRERAQQILGRDPRGELSPPTASVKQMAGVG